MLSNMEAGTDKKISPHDGYQLAAWQPKFTKATLPCKPQCERAENSLGVDEGRGWSFGRAV